MDDVHCTSPDDMKSDRGCVGGSLGKGTGVLFAGVMASSLVKDVFGHDDGNHAIIDVNFG
jgi:hypothetical protein